MGNIYKRNGVWYVDLRVQGKRIRKKVGSSKKVADLALQDLQVKAERNQLGFLERREIAIKDLMNEFLTHSKANHRPSSHSRYRAAIQNFLTYIEKKTNLNRASQVTTETVEKFRIWRKTTPVARNGSLPEKVNPKAVSQGAKSYTVNFEVRALRTIFNFGIKGRYLEVNPVKGMKFLKTDDSKQRRFLSDAECELLLKNCSEEEYPIFATFLNTGMRRAELVNLEWNDIDFKQGVIKIRRKSFWTPKSGEREIPMNDTMDQLLSTIPQKSDFVFCNKKGEKSNPDSIRMQLREIAERAKIKNLTEIHALRHTFASRLIQKGVDLPSVQKLMGHTNIQTTMIYSHQTTDHLRNAISKISL